MAQDNPRKDAHVAAATGGSESPWPAAIAVVLSLASALYLVLRIPVGIPGQWWTPYRTMYPSAPQVAVLALALGLFLAAAFLIDLLAPKPRSLSCVFVGVLTIAYALLLFAIASAGPLGRAGLVAPAFKFDACGLFAREAAKITGVRSYVATFPDTLREYARDYRETVRVNNNPPGTTMVFVLARELASRWPSVAALAEASVFGTAFSPPDARHAWTVLGAWLLLLGAASSFVPACLVMTKLRAGPAAFPTAVAMLAGSLVLFNPSNDALQVAFFLWMIYFYLRGRGGHAAAWGVASGLIAALAFFFTLTTAVVVIVLFAYTVAEVVSRKPSSLAPQLQFWGAAALGLLVGFGVFCAALRYNSFDALAACYRNHAAFYRHFPRTYWMWLLYNPVEFTLFLGGPLAGLVGWAACRRAPSDPHADSAQISPRRWLLVTLLVICLLDVSGKNASEVNRLWLFFMPMLALPACALLARAGGLRRLALIGVFQAATVLLLCLYLDVWRAEALLRELQKYTGQ